MSLAKAQRTQRERYIRKPLSDLSVLARKISSARVFMVSRKVAKSAKNEMLKEKPWRP